jgi:hypothetical protein
VNRAPHPSAAAAWTEFMRSDAAASVYNRHGFDYLTAEERRTREQQ